MSTQEPSTAERLERAFVEPTAPEPVPTTAIGLPTVLLGPKLFSFHSFNDWVSTAKTRWRNHKVTAAHTLCIDAQGRVIGWGAHFMTARDDHSFPVDVYMLRADMVEAKS
jgi:hypothetical protein